MERDEEDFLLYHARQDLLEWDIQEEPGASSSEATKEKPEFIFRYILRRNDALHFDFRVEGITVPMSPFPFKFRLLLASSRENSLQSPETDYNAHITKGSNRVHLKKKELLQERVYKTFNWSWRENEWRSVRPTAVYIAQEHDVEVSVEIISHEPGEFPRVR